MHSAGLSSAACACRLEVLGIHSTRPFLRAVLHMMDKWITSSQ